LAPAAAAAALPLAPRNVIPIVPAAERPSPYRLQWWQVVAGVLVLCACGLLVLGALARVRRQSVSATQTAIAALLVAPTAEPATATTAPTQAATAATAGLAQRQILAAESDLDAGQTDAALALLDQAVAADRHDTDLLLKAGDLALGHRLAVEALRRYYVPGVAREGAAPDGRASEMQSHAALAFYLAAADQTASVFLADQVSAYPVSVV